MVVIRTEQAYLVLSLKAHGNPQESEEERWRGLGMWFLCPIIQNTGTWAPGYISKVRRVCSQLSWGLPPCSSDYEVVCRRGERGSHLPHPLTTPSIERKKLGKVEETPTSEHDTAKDSVVPVHGGAVPAVVAELVLTLSDPFSGTLTHRAHDVWVTLAQLPLPAHQTRDIVTDHSGPQCPDVPARWKWPCQSIPALLLH